MFSICKAIQTDIQMKSHLQTGTNFTLNWNERNYCIERCECFAPLSRDNKMKHEFVLWKGKTVRSGWNEREETSQSLLRSQKARVSLHLQHPLNKRHKKILHNEVNQGTSLHIWRNPKRKKLLLKWDFWHTYKILVRKQSSGIRQGRFHCCVKISY